jgi:hypothetical protein
MPADTATQSGAKSRTAPPFISSTTAVTSKPRSVRTSRRAIGLVPRMDLHEWVPLDADDEARVLVHDARHAFEHGDLESLDVDLHDVDSAADEVVERPNLDLDRIDAFLARPDCEAAQAAVLHDVEVRGAPRGEADDADVGADVHEHSAVRQCLMEQPAGGLLEPAGDPMGVERIHAQANPVDVHVLDGGHAPRWKSLRSSLRWCSCARSPVGVTPRM